MTLVLSSPSNASLGSSNPTTLTILDDETPQAVDEVYRYNKIGNLIYKTGLAPTSTARVRRCRSDPSAEAAELTQST